MKIRLRSNKRLSALGLDEGEEAGPLTPFRASPEGSGLANGEGHDRREVARKGEASVSFPGTRVSQRHFLKIIGAAVGAAGVTQLLATPRSAEAADLSGDNVILESATQNQPYIKMKGTYPGTDMGAKIVLGDDALIVQTGDADSEVSRLTVTRAGNVGIGTTSPGQKLDVRGRAFLESIESPDQIYTASAYGGFGRGQNFIGSSENFETGWSYAGITTTQDQADAPNGTHTADSVNFSSTSYTKNCEFTPSGGVGGRIFTFSLWMRAPSGTRSIGLKLTKQSDNNAVAGTADFTVDATWRRYWVTGDFTGLSDSSGRAHIVPLATGEIYVWGGQIVEDSVPGSYLATYGAPVTTPIKGLAVSGWTKLGVDSTTRVGIGVPPDTFGLHLVANTGDLLHVSNGGADLILRSFGGNTTLTLAANVQLSNTDAGLNLRSYTSGKQVGIWVDESDSQKLKINTQGTNDSTGVTGTTRLALTQDGNLGIGATAPVKKLDVSGASEDVGIAVGPTTDNYGTLWLRGGSQDIYWSLSKRTSGDTPANGFRLAYHDASGWKDAAIAVATDGKVGIGTTTPDSKLHLDSGSLKIGTKVVADSVGSYYA